MAGLDIRWKQRFSNFQKALSQLRKFIEKKDLSDMEEQGLIQAFEYTFELTWNVIKDYYEYQGEEGIQGSRDAFRLAFRRNLITDGQQWMKMIESRVKATHTYNEAIAREIADLIRTSFFKMFESFETAMSEILSRNLQSD